MPSCHAKPPNHTEMRKHFMQKHPTATLCILEEDSQPLPRCSRCDMHLPYTALNGSHESMAFCRMGAERKRKRQLAQRLRAASSLTIEIDSKTVELVPFFKYLGRILCNSNSDWPAVYKNLAKARSKWALISRPLLKTGVKPRVVGMFYKAIVQSVLLFGSETWVVTPQMLQALSAFHNRVARRIANKLPQRQRDGSWTYPPLSEALKDAGLYSLQTYISRRQNTIAEWVATRPIYQLCHQALPVPD